MTGDQHVVQALAATGADPGGRPGGDRGADRRLAPLVDVMLGNEEDFTACLGFTVPDTDASLSELDAANFRRMIAEVARKYPNFAVIATAYAAAKTCDAGLAARAWQEFHTGHAGCPRNPPWQTERVEPPAVLKPIDKTSFASTNVSSQYGLAAIQCLAWSATTSPDPDYFGAPP